MKAEDAPSWVVVGKVVGVYGIKGWLRIQSYTEPLTNILNYVPWRVEHGTARVQYEVITGRSHGRSVIARLGGVEDRDIARSLIGGLIRAPRNALPRTGADEFYWADLEGLVVTDSIGQQLGHVDHVIATGSNDVLVVAGERERLIPFLLGEVVLDVDLAKQTIRVDWDADF